MAPLPLLQLTLPVVVALVAVAYERRDGDIPNRLCGVAFLAAWPLAFLAGTLPQAAVACVLAAALCLPLWRTGSLGGGALKLTVAIAALTSWHVVAAVVAVGAAALGLAYLRARQRASEDLLNDLDTIRGSPLITLGTVIGLVAARLLP